MSNRVDMSKLHYVAWLNSGGSRRMSREDQFKGWAKAVWEEMQELGRGTYVDANGFTRQMLAIEVEEVYIGILARAGYDFACHIASYVSEGNAAAIEVRFKSPQEVVDNIPDMPELPLTKLNPP